MATAIRCQSLGYPATRSAFAARHMQGTTTTAAAVYIWRSLTAGQLHSQRSFCLNSSSSHSLVLPRAPARSFKRPAALPQQIPVHPALTRTRSSSTSSTAPAPSSSQSSSTMAQKSTSLTSTPLIDLLANRRSYYTLNSSLPIPDSQVQEILTKVLLTVPSAFNMQSCRMVLTVGPDHQFVWDTTAKVLREHMGEERWASAPTEKKLQGFRAAHGTVLFYEDNADVDKMKESFAAYKDKFSPWADHSQGMHQLAVWTALAAENVGCNLQHYNPVIDKDLADRFGVPATWELKAQLVFGGIEGDRPAPKDKKSTETTLKVFGV